MMRYFSDATRQDKKKHDVFFDEIIRMDTDLPEENQFHVHTANREWFFKA